ncbi:MAG: hypothetical protein M9937_27060 [Chelatococcus sp.]|uniref:hypothetical protein n=2 Tax=Chelatococcus TaxID=28209 RepID=UPI00224BCAE2|nr:hypothetical protein [Chelatococcus sp.]MCO5079330.1 hypothetical protein [Chelatococcus sp.]CAH1666618.1 conserved hypothetical protein [Hyphomicrobiales bacterium]CAH1680440.1 conserved hypothetical protein [Hyphomicrobiales bacterium]
MCTEMRTRVSWGRERPQSGKSEKGIAPRAVVSFGAMIAILVATQGALAQTNNQFQRDYQQQNRAIERQLQDNSQQQLQQQQMNQLRNQQMRQQLTPPAYVPPPPVQNFRR